MVIMPRDRDHADGDRALVTVVIPASMAAEQDRLLRAIDGRARLVIDEAIEDISVLTGPTVVVTGMGLERLRELLTAPGLAWVHSVSSGVEHLPLAELASRGIILTNSAGAHAPAMAEHVLGVMIAMAHGLPVWAEGQRAREWLPLGAVPVRLLHGKLLGIVGYGAVGRKLATAARALGMRCWGLRRTPLFLSGEPLERVVGADGLRELLEASDIVALCASLNATSRQLLGAPELAWMKHGALLVNVARGGLVDEQALAESLAAGHLGGAAIDATTVEPLPPDSPLWTAPRLLLTPHVSGSSPESWEAVVEFLAQNLGVYLSGTPERLGNRVRYESVR